MPPRPVLKGKPSRPASQIYIGKGASPSLQDLVHSASSYSSLTESTSPGALPDLPEPPSPSSSAGSVKSGLPSPPATNSTGSGSTGDPATVRDRPLSNHSNSSTSTEGHSVATLHMKHSSSRLEDNKQADLDAEGDYDENYDHDNEDNVDGEDTARLGKFLSKDNSKQPSEHALALQRVKSLAQRNRMALDKLSRLKSPSPTRSSTPNSHASSSSPRNPPRQIRALPPLPQETTRSGSETEKESIRHSTQSSKSSSSHSNSSHHRSISISSTRPSTTPPPSITALHRSPGDRLRQNSAPGSPHKARLVAAGTASTSSLLSSNASPSNRRRHRASMASVSQLQLTDFEEADDEQNNNRDRTTTSATNTARERNRQKTLNERDMIIQSALAAAAMSRRSPTNNRRRSALPKEFRADLVEDAQSPIMESNGRRSVAERSFDGDNRQESWKQPQEPVTPFRANVMRSSTLRELRRSGSVKQTSEDFQSTATVRPAFNTSHSNEEGNPRVERRQSLRGGSAESALWSPGGRSLIGEGLRAAGLSRKRDTDGSGTSMANGDLSKERLRRIDWSPQDFVDNNRRRTITDRDRERPPRASTSMAHYQYHEELEFEGARGHRSSYSLASKEQEPLPLRTEREMPSQDRAGSALTKYHNTGPPLQTASPTPMLPSHLLERSSTASPFATRRYSGQPQAQSEHTRLMLESLSRFEAQLGKLSQLGSGSGNGSSHLDLLRNTQSVVQSAERISGIMKVGAAKAMEAQVVAEVESGVREIVPNDCLEIWHKVGGDYREGSRAADELVRGITALLLGVGRIMREYGAASGASDFGSPAMHARSISLDEDARGGVDLGSSGNGSAVSGRHSVASRRSWEPSPRDRDREREEALRKLAGSTQRPESVLARESPATFQKLRDRERDRDQLETPPHATQTGARNTPGSGVTRSGSTRRLFTPREQREQLLDAKIASGSSNGFGHARNFTMATVDSQETLHPNRYEPSPTPAARIRRSPATERIQALTPLKIPKPLPSLPSESVRRHPSVTANNNDKASIRRSTLRGTERPSFPSITTPGSATTAVTPHTVSNTPLRSAFPLPRSDSAKALDRSQVTFSRPTAISVSAALSDLQQRSLDNDKLRVGSSSTNAEPSSSVRPDSHAVPPPRAIAPTQSGSETERDVRKKTGSRMMRMSLDGQIDLRDRDEGAAPAVVQNTRNSTVHPADRSAATVLQQNGGVGRRERRRTVTDIWPVE